MPSIKCRIVREAGRYTQLWPSTSVLALQPLVHFSFSARQTKVLKDTCTLYTAKVIDDLFFSVLKNYTIRKMLSAPVCQGVLLCVAPINKWSPHSDTSGASS